MYCKLFASLYQGTLRGRSNEILVFTNLLANAGKDGKVDKHFRAVAEETGLTVDEVRAAITVLESPDPESRSPEADGARLVRMDAHRAWGWRVVNYGKYRSIRSEEDRAEQNRLAQQRWRNKHKPSSAASNAVKPKQREKQRQRDKKSKSLSATAAHDSAFVDGLKSNPAYVGIDIGREFGKMAAWLTTPRGKGRRLTKAFAVNWLNKADATMQPPAEAADRPAVPYMAPSRI